MSKANKPNNNKGRYRHQPYGPPIAPPEPTTMTPSPVSPSGNRAAGPWSPQDDEQLKLARQRGMNWAPIATQFFPSKTANACRKRHERLIEKSHANEEWPQSKLDDMARCYLDLREQMWSMVSSRFGEPWKTVEAKCMEKGIKTLQSSGRRRDRASNADDTSPNNDNFDDSGLGLGPDSDRQQQDRQQSNSDVGHSHSSRRSTYSNVSSYGTTPLIPASPQPPHQPLPHPQYQHPSPRPISHQPYQYPSAIIQQQQQHQNHLPSIHDVLATTAPQMSAVSAAI